MVKANFMLKLVREDLSHEIGWYCLIPYLYWGGCLLCNLFERNTHTQNAKGDGLENMFDVHPHWQQLSLKWMAIIKSKPFPWLGAISICVCIICIGFWLWSLHNWHSSVPSWWLNHPFWKIWISSPIFGGKNKEIYEITASGWFKQVATWLDPQTLGWVT